MVDAGTLELVLWHIHNWFDHGSYPVKRCEISGGELPASVSIPSGAWYRIQGSLFNDGLHVSGESDLVDETFDGTVTLCAIPKALLVVAENIQLWLDDNAAAREAAQESPYQSESFGGYTYTLKDASASLGASQGLSGWQQAFADDLNPWRKIS